MSKTLLVRVDAGTRIGSGHVMRCLAVAQTWLENGAAVHFLVSRESMRLAPRLRQDHIQPLVLDAEPGSVKDAHETARCAQDLGASWVLTDGLHFDAAYQQRLKQKKLGLACIDDLGLCTHYRADVVLNQNLHANASMYSEREPYTRLLLGCAYVQLRQEFHQCIPTTRRDLSRTTPLHILVTMGGADPDNATQHVLNCLKHIPLPCRIRVLVGKLNRHREELIRSAATMDDRCEVIDFVDDMPALMTWAHLAVSSGGTTVWELAYMGVASIVGVIAPIEETLVRGLREHGLFQVVGWYNQLDARSLLERIHEAMSNAAWRAEMSALGRRLVDGKGNERFWQALTGEQDKRESKL